MSARRYLINLLIAVLPPTRYFGFKRYLWQLMGVTLGADCNINSGAKIWGSGPVSVGTGCWLGMNFTVIVPAGAEVTVGSNVDVAPDVLFECGSHEIGSSIRRAGSERAANIEVGSGTWIGCRATLLGGARLGAGTVVAAGAIVVAGDYPSNALLAGVPARVLRILNDDEKGT